jgi:LysM repeat protein
MMFKNEKSAARRPVRRLIPRKTLHSRAATGSNEVDDYDSEGEPGMKLSQAFIVVLVLHILAVAGIYGFNKLQEKPAVPTAKKEMAAPVAPQTAAAVQAKPEAVPQTYTVVAGDTLRRISSKFKTSIEAIEKANNLTSTSILKVGQVLVVGSTSHSAQATLPAGKAASTPALVAKAPPIKLPATQTESSQKPQTKAQPVPPKNGAAAEPAAPQAESGKVHIVAKGENPFSIAKKYNTTQAALMKANNINDPRTLQIGQKLVLP